MFRCVYRDPEVPASVRLMAGKMVLDRGYGETVKQFNINMDERTAGVKRSVIVLPDNGRRDAIEGPVIDAECVIIPHPNGKSNLTSCLISQRSS